MDPLLDRIVLDPDALAGKPVVRGTRLSVEFLLGLLASGATHAEVLDECAGLTEDDLRACLPFASTALGDQSFVPIAA